MVCGIQPKATDRDLIEAEKLSDLYTSWLKASGATNIAEPIFNSSSEKVKTLILNNF